MIDLERELKDESTESKITQIGSIFAEKSKSGVKRNFWRDLKKTENKRLIKLN